MIFILITLQRSLKQWQPKYPNPLRLWLNPQFNQEISLNKRFRAESIFTINKMIFKLSILSIDSQPSFPK